MQSLKIVLTTLVLLFFFLGCQSKKTTLNNEGNLNIQPLVGLPLLTKSVTDFENIFNEEQEAQLTKIILDFEKKTTNQIAIVTLDSIAGYSDFNQFVIKMSHYNGIGVKGKDNGLCIAFSRKIRKIFIATGTGTRDILTDSICKNVIDAVIIPQFKKDNYYKGTELGLKKLISVWENN